MYKTSFCGLFPHKTTCGNLTRYPSLLCTYHTIMERVPPSETYNTVLVFDTYSTIRFCNRLWEKVCLCKEIECLICKYIEKRSAFSLTFRDLFYLLIKTHNKHYKTSRQTRVTINYNYIHIGTYIILLIYLVYIFFRFCV